MRKSNVSRPLPYLKDDCDDYVDCSFSISDQNDVFDSKQEVNGKFSITIKYHLKCQGLMEMIEKDEAKVVLYLESRMTNYRRACAFNSNASEIVLDIHKNEVGDYIDIKPFIVSNVDKDSFRLEEHNKIFNNANLILKKGDYLAEAKGLRVLLNKYDPLADKPSIFKIQVNYEMKKTFEVSWEEDYILIILNEKLHGLYNKISQEPNFRIILSSLFVTPALVDVLAMLKNATEDDLESYKDKKWYEVITARLKKLKIDIKDEYSMLQVANEVLPIIPTSISNIDYIVNELYNDKGDK